MLRDGDTVDLESGSAVIKQELGIGKYGTVFEAIRSGHGGRIAVKVLKKPNDDYLWRLDALQGAQLAQRIPGAAGIIEVLRQRKGRDWEGCVMPYAQGISLGEWIDQQASHPNLLTNLHLAVQIIQLIADTHALGLVHGDIHPGNFIVAERRGVHFVTLIDWDNALIPGMPPPMSLGAVKYFAPETMQAYIDGVHYSPDVYTERCAVAKVLHWLLFGRAYYQTDDDHEFERATLAGKWNSSPSDESVDIEELGGTTNQWINGEVAHCFRRAGGQDREARPTMAEWLSTLLPYINQGLPSCDTCGHPVLPALRTHCPSCNARYPVLAVVSPGGSRISVNGSPLLLGRGNLQSESISRRHAVLTPLGPETVVTDLGSKNGTFRRGRKRWVRLPSHQQCLLRSGDHIRCGEVELQIVAS